jgi:dimethylhistidine N-methyltransferase
MSATLDPLDLCDAVAVDAVKGLTAQPKTLPAWLFYDSEGTLLFEKITCLPEYYLTRIERELLQCHAREVLDIVASGACLNLVELGAGTANKTGFLLREALQKQQRVAYQPVDVSKNALAIAKMNIESAFVGVEVRPQIADYTVESLNIERESSERVLLIYLGSSIGNFTTGDRRLLLKRLREQLRPADRILIGADLVKDRQILLPAYNDAEKVTAAFNLNVLTRLNRELGTDFNLKMFEHLAVWNPDESRIEMHLESQVAQRIAIPCQEGRADLVIHFAAGETIHTENSYKFTAAMISSQLMEARFAPERVWNDPESLFSLTLAEAF